MGKYGVMLQLLQQISFADGTRLFDALILLLSVRSLLKLSGWFEVPGDEWQHLLNQVQGFDP